ncbi:MAG: hypothetical protein J7521_05785 [Caulobacter sp.]|nr:hypothetical protein [Caulobacter sp.]
MKLSTRARLAWIPLLLWCAAGLAIGWTEASKWKGDDSQDWMILAIGGASLFLGGAWNFWRLRQRAVVRARVEGPDVDVPMTWHRKSGSWAVIAFAAGVVGIFALVWLIGGRIR